MAWLREHARTLEEAQRCLAERLATLGPEGADPYNDGGTAATREYIAERAQPQPPPFPMKFLRWLTRNWGDEAEFTLDDLATLRDEWSENGQP